MQLFVCFHRTDQESYVSGGRLNNWAAHSITLLFIEKYLKIDILKGKIETGGFVFDFSSAFPHNPTLMFDLHICISIVKQSGTFQYICVQVFFRSLTTELHANS